MKNEIVCAGAVGHLAKEFMIHMTILAHQKAGGAVAMIAYSTLLGHSAIERGVKVQDVLVSTPDTHKQAREILESLLRSGVCSLVVVEGWGIWQPGAFDTMIEDLVRKTGVTLLHVA